MEILLETLINETTFKALIGGLIFAIVAPIIGQFMVFRGYSGISDGIGHIALVGIGAGLIAGQWQTFWGFSITILLALMLEFLRQNRFVRGETSIALFIIFSLSILAIIEETLGLTTPIEELFFGSITDITYTNIVLLLIIAIVSIVFVVSNYRSLVSISFNEELARLSGIKINLFNYILIVLVAVIVVQGVTIVGGLLVGSLMIIPVAASSLFGLGFQRTHVISVILSVTALVFGLFIGLVGSIPVGACIALVSVILFTIALIVKVIQAA